MPDEETAGKDSTEEVDDSAQTETGDKTESDQETTTKQDSQKPSETQKQLDALQEQLKSERKKATDFQAAKDKLETQVKEKDREGMDELERAKTDAEEAQTRLQDSEEQILALQTKLETQKVLSDLSDSDTKKIVGLLVTEPEGDEEVTLEGIAKEIDKVIQGIRKSSKAEDNTDEASSVDAEVGNTALQPKVDVAKEALDKKDYQGAILAKLNRRKRK